MGDSRSLGGWGAEPCRARAPRSTSSPFTDPASEPCATDGHSPGREIEKKRLPLKLFINFSLCICVLLSLLSLDFTTGTSTFEFNSSSSIYICHTSLPGGGSGDPGGNSTEAQTAAPSASRWLSSSCQMMELESGTFSASGIPEPVTATLAGPGSWTCTCPTVKNEETQKGKSVISGRRSLYCRTRTTWEVVGSTLRFFFWFCLLVLG